MLANMVVRVERSLVPSLLGARGVRIFAVLEFFNFFAGGSRGFEKSVFEEMRVDREPALFRELEASGKPFVAFMPEKVRLEGPRDVTLHPRKGFD